MKKIIFLFLVTLSLFSCHKDHEETEERRNGRTVLAFFWADNDLDDYLRTNIQTMMQSLHGMKEAATLLVYWDGTSGDANWKEPCILEYTTDGHGSINGVSAKKIEEMIRDKGQQVSLYELVGLGEIKKEYPSQVSTEKAVVQMVIADMIKAAPSDSYGIIFGSHGSGWLPTLTGRSIGQDGPVTCTIRIPELAEAMRAANPQKFDFVLFDACMMSCAEVCYELKDATRYCIASVLDVPAAGVPYVNILPYLYKSDMEASLTSVCKEYIRYYNTAFGGWGTISAIDCSQMEGLAEVAREALVSHQENLKQVDVENLQEYGRQGSFRGYAYDVVQFVKTLCEGELPAAFAEQFDKTVLYTDYVAGAQSPFQIDGNNYCGMGMYIPNASTTGKYQLWNGYFKSSIAWYRAAGWADTEAIWGK